MKTLNSESFRTLIGGNRNHNGKLQKGRCRPTRTSKSAHLKVWQLKGFLFHQRCQKYTDWHFTGNNASLGFQNNTIQYNSLLTLPRWGFSVTMQNIILKSLDPVYKYPDIVKIDFLLCFRKKSESIRGFFIPFRRFTRTNKQTNALGFIYMHACITISQLTLKYGPENLTCTLKNRRHHKIPLEKRTGGKKCTK